MTTGIEPRLTTIGLSKSFGRDGVRVEALRDINISVADGEFVSIVGASGCGKSTFLRLVDGLTPPSEGEVQIDGRTVREPGPDRAFVFQQDRMLPWRRIEENIGIGLEMLKVAKGERHETVTSLLDLVGLTGFANSYPHELSGGMRQRANLARALAVDPEVLLMDEPFAALDGQTREIMQAELLRIWSERQKTVLFVTHQINEAVYLSDRVLVFTVRPGRVKADIRIDLPRPRGLSVKSSPAFVQYIDQVWRLIEVEVKASMSFEKRSLPSLEKSE